MDYPHRKKLSDIDDSIHEFVKIVQNFNMKTKSNLLNEHLNDKLNIIYKDYISLYLKEHKEIADTQLSAYKDEKTRNEVMHNISVLEDYCNFLLNTRYRWL